MPRFFMPDINRNASEIVLTGESAQHGRVLRLSKGETVTVFDGNGTDFICTVDSALSREIYLSVLQAVPSSSEPGVSFSVYMALSKADKFEHVIQKATEIGAAELITFPSSRSVVKADIQNLAKKLDRWQKIASSAAEQSGRGRIPEIRFLPSFQSACQEAVKSSLPLFFYENERSHSLTERLNMNKSYASVSLMSGPEGGFSEEEVRLAEDAGMLVTSLGKRILRCETAPLFALSACVYALENI